MTLIRLRVSWGGSPETDDSAVAYVTVSSQRIVVIHHFRLVGWWIWHAAETLKEEVNLGHGYDRRDVFERILMRLERVPLGKPA